mgnify:CR=1 FL=1
MGSPAQWEKVGSAAPVPATCRGEVLTKTEAFRRRRNLEPKSYFLDKFKFTFSAGTCILGTDEVYQFSRVQPVRTLADCQPHFADWNLWQINSCKAKKIHHFAICPLKASRRKNPCSAPSSSITIHCWMLSKFFQLPIFIAPRIKKYLRPLWTCLIGVNPLIWSHWPTI